MTTNDTTKHGGRRTTLALTVLVALFALIGTPPLIHGILRLLPTTDTDATLESREREPTSGLSMHRLAHAGGWVHYVTLGMHDGTTKRVRVPERVYDRFPGFLASGCTVKLRSTTLGNKPVALLVSKRLLYKPGSILERAIRGKNAPASAPPTDVYDLLVPLTGMIVAALFFWAMVLYLFFKLPKTMRHHRRWMVIGVLMAVGLGAWWALATL